MAKRNLTGDSVVDELMAKFDFAYQRALPRFEVFERIQQSYDNNINLSNWPTLSEVPIPVTFTAVEEQLPFAMKYLFPENRFIELIPEAMMDAKAVQNVEDNLLHTVRTEMDLALNCLPSIRDCFKFGVGYGMIDTQYITPPTVMNNMLINNGEIIGDIPQFTMGTEKQVLVYRYLPVICVIPMPDGANVEGPNKASGHFIIDFKNEAELRDMYKRKDLNGMPLYKGDIEKILEDARVMNYDSRFNLADKIASLSGYDLPSINQGDRNIPVFIPIIRCYFDHSETWLVNGKIKMWEMKDKYQTMTSDLIKFSATPDGTKWYPMNPTEASERLAGGINIWYNGLIDLAMYIMNPTRVINTDMVDDPATIGRGPQADIKVTGDANKAVNYMELPQFPTQLFEMGDLLQSMHSNTNSQLSSVKNGQVGMVRGGSNALETMLSTSTGRQFLAACVMKTGGLKPAIEKILIKKQLMIDSAGDKFIDVQYDPQTGDRQFAEKTVTMQEMRNIFRVTLNLPVARMNSAAAFAERTAYFDRAMGKDPELFDKRRMYEMLSEDEALVRRTMLSENVVKEREEAMANARVASAERGEQQNGQGQASNVGEQALAGAANISGA